MPTLAHAQELPDAFAGAQAIDIFVLFDGIAGESADKDHARWIDVLSYSHALSSPATIVGGGGGAGKPQHEPVAFTKFLDAASPELIKALNQGKHVKDATFEFVRTGDRPFKFLTVKLEDVILTSYAISAAAGSDFPVEAVGVVYKKITWTYVPQKADGSAGTPITTSYDVSTNVANSVALSSFDVFAEEDAVVFTWRTLSEDANYGFELQHWENGSFRRAAYVPGAGWSQKPLQYEVRIRGLEKGIHVFRLALLGLDGSVGYSEEVDLAFGVPEGVDVVVEQPYPNPFTHEASVFVSVARPMEARVALCDLLGREVAVVFEGLLEPGGAEHLKMAADAALPAGLYALRVETPGAVQTRMLTLMR